MPRSSSARTYKEAQSFKVVNSRHRAIFFKVEVKNYDAYPLVKDLLEALEFAAVLDESTLDAIPTALVDDNLLSNEKT